MDKNSSRVARSARTFQMSMSDSKLRGIVLRPDDSFVDLKHPAHRGEILRYYATDLVS
jgi:hypothetical protein